MEKWDLYDENRQPLGRLHTRGDEMMPAEYHIVVGIWVVNDKNEILLTLRAPEKDDYPGLWENTGGSVLAGETSREGARRELLEETGIIVSEFELAFLGTNKTNSGFVDLYAIRKDLEIDELTFQDGETTDAKWVSYQKLNEMAASGEIAKPIAERLEILRSELEAFIFRDKLKTREYIFVDLDGTITDSAEGIINSAIYAADKMGIEFHDRDMLRGLIGPPLKESFAKLFKLTHEETEIAIKYYREYYKEKGVYENEVYAGVESVLKQLSDAGRKIILATSKAEYYAEVVLEHFGLRQYFSFVAGSNLDGTRTDKAEVIAYALKNCGIEPQQAVMIGDRVHDISGARKNAIDSIGVLYGYGSYEELWNAGATYIAGDASELAQLLGIN